MKYLPAIWHLLQGQQSLRSEEHRAGAREEAETLASTVPPSNPKPWQTLTGPAGKSLISKEGEIQPFGLFCSSHAFLALQKYSMDFEKSQTVQEGVKHQIQVPLLSPRTL